MSSSNGTLTRPFVRVVTKDGEYGGWTNPVNILSKNTAINFWRAGSLKKCPKSTASLVFFHIFRCSSIYSTYYCPFSCHHPEYIPHNRKDNFHYLDTLSDVQPSSLSLVLGGMAKSFLMLNPYWIYPAMFQSTLTVDWLFNPGVFCGILCRLANEPGAI